MTDTECPPVTVEGDWSPTPTKTVKNKLLVYFQSKKKSSGGDCRVEVEDGALRATVYFTSEEVRERVLTRQNHEIILDGKTVKLCLTSSSSQTDSEDVPAPDSKTQESEAEPANGASAERQEVLSESVQGVAVVLDNVADNMSRDVLTILVESVSGLDDSSFSLEIIWETKTAVITFNSPAEAQKFLTVSQCNKKLQRHGLTARPLEATKSIRLESLPPTVVKELLELYFEKNWTLPDNIIMIPEEQAAIITFTDPKVVESICTKKDHLIRSIPVKVYPFYERLGSALYGEEQPTWKMPEPFIERLHHAVWKFVLMKKLLKSINDQMRPYFCYVDLDDPEVKLSPLPSFVRQKGLTAKQVDMWKSTAQKAFCQQMSQYAAFECPVSAPAWKATEKDVRSIVRDDAILVVDTTRGFLTVAGRADSIKHIRAPVENTVLKAMSQIERQKNGTSEVMTLSPAMFYILKQEGLQKAALDISPDMKLSYNEGTQVLTIAGLPAEVFKTKAWILERKVGMSKKQVDVRAEILDFLRSVDPMDMSQDMFTSQGISAIYSVENRGVLLLGSSDRVLADAESKMKTVLSWQTLNVEDEEVLKLDMWVDLKNQLLDTYNSLKKKTVIIQMHPQTRKITVAGFTNPVKEVSQSLKDCIVNYSQIDETFRVESCAVVQFIDKKKRQEWSSIAKTNEVTIHFDAERPKIIISGARLHVQRAKSCFQKLTSSLFTDNLIVDKPGAKKYFQSQGSLFLSTIMTELNCVVILRPENQEEEEEENSEEENGFCYCKVTTTSGVLVSVCKADICSLSVDAVVNAANEELKHIGGLALALLKSAGQELQKICDDFTATNGNLRPGDAVATGACSLPCKYVVHAVGPRFSDYDKKTAVSHLKLAVKESLRQAEKVKCSTIALPAISSGVFGFPVDLCADTIAQAVREYCSGPESPGTLTEIQLVDNNDNTVRALATAVDRQFADLGAIMMVPQQARGRSPASGYRGRGARPKFSERGGGRGGGRGGRGGRGGGKRGAWGTGVGGSQGPRRGQSPREHSRPEGHGGSGRLEQTTSEGLKIVLWKGNIQDQTTDVIVNTIAENMNLDQGAVSKAILLAAGPSLQSAVQSEARVATLQYGDVVITDSFNLMCQKVFHAVCPIWDNGAGQAEEVLKSIIRYCLVEAENRRMTSLSFPAIGTGNLSFPRGVVCRVLLKEIHSYSSQKTSHHLREVAIVVHPSDAQTVDCFTREFKGQPAQRNSQHQAQEFNDSPVGQSVSKSSKSPASFSQVSSPSLGVYRMQMGQLALEVSSGDITKQATEVIVNSSNHDFTLQSGVSKAILDSAGLTVQQECSQIVNSPGYQPRSFIMTSAGLLPSKNIIHIVGRNDPARIKDIVYAVLKFCEENKYKSVSFPALGTGQGGANPSAVADAMVDAVVDFVRKKQPKFVNYVKILIFQTFMVTEFQKTMKKREGEEVEEKSVLTRIKDSVTSLFAGFTGEQHSADGLVLEREEFEPTVFQLCTDNKQTVSQVKKRIKDLIVAEQANKTISDPFISHLSQDDMDQLRSLQRKLTVSIHLDRGLEDQESKIHLEGLTRDVFTAESAVREIIQKVERKENLKSKALLMTGLVEWQFQPQNGTMVTFDMYINLTLEEALDKKQRVKIEIQNEMYEADVMSRKAVAIKGANVVELCRKVLKDDAALPSHWDDMKTDLLKLIPLTAGSKEYREVETEVKKNGLAVNIISIERVQNVTLWKSYQLMKKQLEVKNKRTNNERQLFHGTGANSIDLINKQGFNRSYAGAHGAAFGNGSYFAVDPGYSAGGYAKADAAGHKRMYLARVLVGDFTQGTSGIVTPPSKHSGQAADLYDSVVDQTANPTMFIIFSDIQAYPEYLITFT